MRGLRESEEYLNAVLEAVKFPARIADLNASLADVDRDALSHFRWKKLKGIDEKLERMREKCVYQDASRLRQCGVSELISRLEIYLRRRENRNEFNRG